MRLNDKNCPYCAGNKFTHYSAQAHDAAQRFVQIIECIACQAAWQWPLQRTEEQSEQVFGDAYASQAQGSYFDQDRRESIATCQRAFINSKGPPIGRLLDIGCGDGVFARGMAQRGWRALGLDPSLKATTAETFPNGFLQLSSEDLASVPATSKFDVVTLWDVVEHVERPDVLLAAATTHLAPGGMLVVETGNYQCLTRLQNRKSWWNYQLDHRWYRAPPQLRAMFERAGLNRVELSDHVLRPWWKGQACAKRPGLRSLAASIAHNPANAPRAWKQHQEFRVVDSLWRSWSGLEIMTMTGWQAS